MSPLIWQMLVTIPKSLTLTSRRRPRTPNTTLPRMMQNFLINSFDLMHLMTQGLDFLHEYTHLIVVFMLFWDLGDLSFLVDYCWFVFLFLSSDVFHQFLQALQTGFYLEVLTFQLSILVYYWICQEFFLFNLGFLDTCRLFLSVLDLNILVINFLLESFVYILQYSLP